MTEVSKKQRKPVMANRKLCTIVASPLVCDASSSHIAIGTIAIDRRLEIYLIFG